MGAKKLSATEKAATVLLALGEEGAVNILRMMPERERILALRALSRLGRVDKGLAEEILREFNETLKEENHSLNGGGDLARRLLSKAIPSSNPDTVDEILSDGSRELIEILRDIDLKILSGFLAREETPQIAVVLAHMDSPRGAHCLKHLPEHLRLNALQKLASLGTIEPSALEDLTAVLRELGLRQNHRSNKAPGGLEKVAAILNALDPSSGQEIMGALSQRDQHLAMAVRELLFQFSDLALLPDKSLVEIIKSVPMETLKIALKKAPDSVCSAFFRNLSERAQTMLRDDIAAMGLVRWTDMQKAQKHIADLARRLIDEGKIAGPNDRGEYV
jgi:flagellar motor switch protein FliG